MPSLECIFNLQVERSADLCHQWGCETSIQAQPQEEQEEWSNPIDPETWGLG